MNTPEPYQRHLDRQLPEPVVTTDAEKAVEALAVHRDPSLPPSAPSSEADNARPSVAWVRPSDLPTVIGGSWARRGIDLQAELTRRARRTPGDAAMKATRRVTRTSIPRPETSSATATTREGLDR